MAGHACHILLLVSLSGPLKEKIIIREIIEHLKIGTQLRLVRETDNQFDPYAVAIWYEELKLGYVPRGENHDISKYLDMGLTDIYEVRITRITPDTRPENQIEVILYIKNPK